MEKSVKLRSIDRGADHFDLWASVTEEGDLLVEGQDFGPSTFRVSSDGEYEYSWLVPADRLPELFGPIGLPEGADLIEHLADQYSGTSSWALEEIIRSSGLGQLSVI